LKNKILIIHAEWLKENGYEYKNCLLQSYPENDKRSKKGKTFKIRNSKGQFIHL
jgi:hypothetical protein